MPATIAEFFSSLPTWVQATVAGAIAIASIVIAWKGVIPHFIHEVLEFHDGVLYRRNRVVIRHGVPKTRGSGFYPILPGIYKYKNTDLRSQLSKTEGFKLDFSTQFVTYHVDGLSITWRVFDAYKYQSVNADPEAFIKDKVREACRTCLIEADDPRLTTDAITEQCRRRTPTLADIGVLLETVLITSGSYETRNHRFPTVYDTLGKTVVMSDDES